MSEAPDLPDCRQLMLPLLKIAAGGETNLRQAVERLSAELGLDAAQRAATGPGGRHAIINHRAHWARTHMMRAGLIERRRRGAFRATARGLALIAAGAERIDDLGIAGWASDKRSKRTAQGAASTRGRANTLQGPDDAALSRALIDRILAMPGRSAFFEDVALHLLTTIGYGNGLDGAATRLGRTGDGGVDAVILLDPLGLDRLYVQAKCHVADNLVDAPMVRDFAGSLEDKKTARGVLITTSGFTRGARAFVRGIPRPIALIDGAEVARLMIKHGVGVKQEPTTGMRKVDEGYFAQRG